MPDLRSPMSAPPTPSLTFVEDAFVFGYAWLLGEHEGGWSSWRKSFFCSSVSSGWGMRTCRTGRSPLPLLAGGGDAFAAVG